MSVQRMNKLRHDACTKDESYCYGMSMHKRQCNAAKRGSRVHNNVSLLLNFDLITSRDIANFPFNSCHYTCTISFNLLVQPIHAIIHMHAVGLHLIDHTAIEPKKRKEEKWQIATDL